jgi:polysaccharide export outer membrane protein
MVPSARLNTHTKIESRHAERSEASLRRGVAQPLLPALSAAIGVAPFVRAVVFALLLALPFAAFAQSQAPAKAPPPQVAQAAPAASQTGDSPLDYSVGPQDLLGITFLEAAELSRDVRVAPDGTVSLPYLAERVRVAGLTLNQAEELLKRKYQEAGILNQPNISITLKELISKPVTVMGAVRSPGVFQLGATLPLMRVITQAGGFAEDAGTIVQVVRAGSSRQDEVIRVRIEDLRMGLLEANIPVYGGDTVNVLPAGSVYVVGAVNRPGRHSLRSDSDQMTLLRLVALAEDTKKTARLDSTVILRKDASGATKEIPVNLKKILQRKAPDVAVLPNDVIFIPDSLGKRALGRFGDSMISTTTTLLLLGLL